MTTEIVWLTMTQVDATNCETLGREERESGSARTGTYDSSKQLQRVSVARVLVAIAMYIHIDIMSL